MRAEVSPVGKETLFRPSVATKVVATAATEFAFDAYAVACAGAAPSKLPNTVATAARIALNLIFFD
jgi:xanthine dehydrogenase molybdopterin-binding subunit B